MITNSLNGLAQQILALTWSERFKLLGHIFRLWLGQTSQTTPAASTPNSSDPLIGLYSGSPNLRSEAKTILQSNLSDRSGLTWKE